MSDSRSVIGNNAPRFRGFRNGGVESWFLRANRPGSPEAFWIKSTVLVPRGGEAVAEAWFAWFGADGKTWAVKQTIPLVNATFSDDGASSVGDCRFEATSEGGTSSGYIDRGERRVRWSLRWERVDGGLGEPLCLYPYPWMLTRGFPKSKLLTPAPVVRFSGTIELPEGSIDVARFTGMQGHNWGAEHAWEYAWGQCVFPSADGEPFCMVEGFSGRIRLGPTTSPLLSAMAVRRRGKTYRFDRVFSLWRQHARIGDLAWSIRLSSADGEVALRLEALPDRMVCLGYRNPDGALAYCLNSKTARAELRVNPRNDEAFSCQTENGAALEILRRTPDARFPDVV